MTGAIELYALGESFEVLAVCIPYVNLQWNRRYYEPGDFSMQVGAEDFDPAWAYVWSPERPEMGMVQKVAYSADGGYDGTVQVSGFFVEKMLDDRVCYPRYTGDEQATETAVRKIFAAYSEGLPISLGPANDPPIGDRTQSDFSDDELGTKLYSILETREASLRVAYDLEANALRLSVWQGLDRTQGQSVNPWAVFSTAWGNLSGESVDLDASAYKNACLVLAQEDGDGVPGVTLTVDLSAEGEMRRLMLLDKRSSKPEDGQSAEDFRAALEQEAMEALADAQPVTTVDADVEGYLDSFDLGDRVSVDIPAVGLAMDARVVEVNEVFKSTGHEATASFGNKKVRRTM